MAEVLKLLTVVVADVKDFVRDMDLATRTVTELATSVAHSVQGVANQVAMVSAALGTGLVVGLGAAAKSAAELDQEMAKLATVLDKEYATPEFIMTLKQGAEDVARAYGIDVVDAINALRIALGSGIKAPDAVQFLEMNAKAAAAGVADLADVVKMSTDLMGSYGYQVKDLGGLFDLLFQGVKVGKMEFSDLAKNLGPLANIASAAKVPMEDLVGSIAALTRAGFQPATAMVSLKNILTEIIHPTEKSAEMAKKLGFDFSAAALKSKGLVKFLNELRTALSKAVDTTEFDKAKDKVAKLSEDIVELTKKIQGEKSAKKRSALETKLAELQRKAMEAKGEMERLGMTAAKTLDSTYGAGQLFGDVRGLAAFLSLANNEGTQFNSIIGEVKNNMGALDQAYKAYASTNSMLQFKQLGADIAIIWRNLGSAVLSIIGPFVVKLREATNWLVSFTRAHPELTSAAAIATAGVAGLLFAIAGIATAVSAAAGAYLLYTSAMTAHATAAALSTAASAASAAGTAAAGVAAGGASVGFWGLAASIWAALAPILVFVAIAAAIVAAIVATIYAANALYENWDAIKDWSLYWWGVIKDTVVSSLQTVWGYMASFGNFVRDVWILSFGGLKNLFADTWGALRDYFIIARDAVVSGFTSMVTKVQSLVSSMKQFFVDLGNTIKDSVSNAFDAAWEKAKGFWEKLKGLGIAGVLSPAAAVGSAVSGAATSMSVPAFASGGIVTRPTFALIGEAGPEVVSPLLGNSPFSLPNLMSALAGAGKTGTPAGFSSSPGNVTNHITIMQQPGQSPAALAQQVATVIMQRMGRA